MPVTTLFCRIVEVHCLVAMYVTICTTAAYTHKCIHAYVTLPGVSYQANRYYYAPTPVFGLVVLSRQSVPQNVCISASTLLYIFCGTYGSTLTCSTEIIHEFNFRGSGSRYTYTDSIFADLIFALVG